MADDDRDRTVTLYLFSYAAHDPFLKICQHKIQLHIQFLSHLSIFSVVWIDHVRFDWNCYIKTHIISLERDLWEK